MAVEAADIDRDNDVMVGEKALHLRKRHHARKNATIGAPVPAEIDQHALVLRFRPRKGVRERRIGIGILVVRPVGDGDGGKVRDADARCCRGKCGQCA